MGSVPAKTPANGWLGSKYVGPTAAMAAAKKPTAAPASVRPPVGAQGPVPTPMPPPKVVPKVPFIAPPPQQPPVLPPTQAPPMKPVLPPAAAPPMSPPVVPPQAPPMKPPMVGRPLPPEMIERPTYTTGLWTPEDEARAKGPTFDPTTGLMSDGSAPPSRPGYGYGQPDPRTGVVHNQVYDYAPPAPRSLADIAMQRAPAKPMPPQPAPPPGRSLMQFASRRY